MLPRDEELQRVPVRLQRRVRTHIGKKRRGWEDCTPGNGISTKRGDGKVQGKQWVHVAEYKENREKQDR